MNDLYTNLNKIFTHGLINGLVTIILIILISLLINKFINKAIEKRDDNRKHIIKRLKNVALTLIVLSCILMQFDSMQSIARTLLAGSGIFAVVIGLASQEAAGNLINGLMLLIYHPFKIGDFISVSEYNIRGKVLDITLRHTIIETLEKTQLIIPNTIMNKAIVENVTDTTGKAKINHFFVNVSYECDLEKAKTILIEEALKHPLFFDGRNKKQKRNKEAAVVVYCTEFKDSGVELRCDIPTIDNIAGFNLMSDLRQTILKRFKTEGIEIPYPHVVVKEK